jgi:hypothetical protein
MAPPYQLWSRPLLSSDNVVVVTNEALVLMSLPLPDLPDVEAGWLRQGKLPPDASILPFSQIHEAYAPDGEGKLMVFHGPDTVGSLKEVFFDGPTPRDQVLHELAARIGPGWELDDRNRTMTWTLGLLLLILAITTAVFFFATRQAEARTGAVTGFEFVADSIGSVGALVSGLAACLLCVWGMVHTWRNPPKGPGVWLKRVGVAVKH